MAGRAYVVRAGPETRRSPSMTRRALAWGGTLHWLSEGASGGLLGVYLTGWACMTSLRYLIPDLVCGLHVCCQFSSTEGPPVLQDFLSDIIVYAVTPFYSGMDFRLRGPGLEGYSGKPLSRHPPLVSSPFTWLHAIFSPLFFFQGPQSFLAPPSAAPLLKSPH